MSELTNREFKSFMIKRTRKFALGTAKVADLLNGGRAVNVACNQLIRSCFAVAANYRSCCKGKSKADFAAKITIVEEEADESAYWLETLVDLGAVSPEIAQPLIKEAYELAAISGSAAKNSKRQL
jgi:four helix bundle protein